MAIPQARDLTHLEQLKAQYIKKHPTQVGLINFHYNKQKKKLLAQAAAQAPAQAPAPSPVPAPVQTTAQAVKEGKAEAVKQAKAAAGDAVINAPVPADVFYDEELEAVIENQEKNHFPHLVLLVLIVLGLIYYFV